jgi:hypothetical protein
VPQKLTAGIGNCTDRNLKKHPYRRKGPERIELSGNRAFRTYHMSEDSSVLTDAKEQDATRNPRVRTHKERWGDGSTLEVP